MKHIYPKVFCFGIHNEMRFSHDQNIFRSKAYTFLLLIQPRSTFYTSGSQSTAQPLRGKRKCCNQKKSKKINTFFAYLIFVILSLIF